MDIDYIQYSKIFKVFSDPKRLKIIDMLSNGELCACKIQEEFQITQPTLSHDMKVLIEANIVIDRREGKNTYYSLNKEQLDSFYQTLGHIFSDKADCICHKLSHCDCD